MDNGHAIILVALLHVSHLRCTRLGRWPIHSATRSHCASLAPLSSSCRDDREGRTILPPQPSLQPSLDFNTTNKPSLNQQPLLTENHAPSLTQPDHTPSTMPSFTPGAAATHIPQSIQGLLRAATKIGWSNFFDVREAYTACTTCERRGMVCRRPTDEFRCMGCQDHPDWTATCNANGLGE